MGLLWAYISKLIQKNIGHMQVVEDSTQVEWPWVGPHFLFWWSSATSTPNYGGYMLLSHQGWWKKPPKILPGENISLPLMIQGSIHQRCCFFFFWWWFGTCFIFPYIGKNNPNWRTHIFQRGRSTTNQHWVVFAFLLGITTAF